jgi:hypothetical protein
MLEPRPRFNLKTTQDTSVHQREIVLSFLFAGDPSFEDLKLCVIPVFVEGTKGKQTFSFLVDTGSSVTVLNSYVAGAIGVELQEAVVGQGVGGSSRNHRVLVRDIGIRQLQEVEGKKVEGMISLGPSRILTGALPNKFSDYSILGILGADIIQDICLRIDYPERYLELSKTI